MHPQIKSRHPVRSAIKTTVHNVFGWLVHQQVFEPGASMIVIRTEDTPAHLAPNVALYVRGHMTATHDAGQTYEIYPGSFTLERPVVPKGRQVVTAHEESEIWCFDYNRNGNRKPKVTPIRLAHNDTFDLLEGQLLLAMHGRAGSFEGPSTHVVESDMTITADGVFYGFIMANARD